MNSILSAHRFTDNILSNQYEQLLNEVIKHKKLYLIDYTAREIGYQKAKEMSLYDIKTEVDQISFVANGLYRAFVPIDDAWRKYMI